MSTESDLQANDTLPIEEELDLVDEQSLFKDSYLNVDPEQAFLINEVVGVILLALFNVNYFVLGNTQPHDTFLWITHSVIWGQNQLVWLAANIFDNITMREAYQRSAFVLGFIPYIMMPIYLLWIVADNLFNRDTSYSS